MQVLYKIKQLELIMVRKEAELKTLNDLFNEKYSDEEREHAEIKKRDAPVPFWSIGRTFEDNNATHV